MKKLLIALVVLVVAFVGGAFLLPGHYEVTRSVVVAAEGEAITQPLADLRTWPEWSAWTKERDPGVEWSFTGDAGEGQVWEWTGDELGHGKLRLQRVTPGKGIQYGIAFFDPDMRGDGAIQVAPGTGGQEVTWIARGSLGRNPVSRWMGLFLDGILGPDLETGLQGLKARAEAAPAVVPADGGVEAAGDTAGNG